jgi:hypothetical protein
MLIPTIYSYFLCAKQCAKPFLSSLLLSLKTSLWKCIALLILRLERDCNQTFKVRERLQSKLKS